MSNPYFIFKQFTIQQDRCAMKVCSDACIFGAWVARLAGELETSGKPFRSILDIGTGTGLLALMIAQKSAAKIDAIDIDESAFLQAKENVSGSDWSGRISVMEADARAFRGHAKYDLVISNPPFYENDLRSPSSAINLARHNTALTFEELLRSISINLSRNSLFAVLLPAHRFAHFVQLAEKMNFGLASTLDIRQTPAHPAFRTIGLFSAQHDSVPVKKEMSIKNGNGYSIEFIDLLKDYYLYLEL